MNFPGHKQQTKIFNFPNNYQSLSAATPYLRLAEVTSLAILKTRIRRPNQKCLASGEG